VGVGYPPTATVTPGPGPPARASPSVCVFITAVPITKLFAWGGGTGIVEDVLRETTSRFLSGLVCPSRTSERGGEGYCVKEGWGGEEEREKERALGRPLCHNPRY
jgi:hypothetical protein